MRSRNGKMHTCICSMLVDMLQQKILVWDHFIAEFIYRRRNTLRGQLMQGLHNILYLSWYRIYSPESHSKKTESSSEWTSFSHIMKEYGAMQITWICAITTSCGILLQINCVTAQKPTKVDIRTARGYLYIHSSCPCPADVFLAWISQW